MHELTMGDIIVRLLSAMLIGLVVGGQRAHTEHPAGLRTNMLVSIGSCVVMMTGIVICVETHALYGSSPDPARLAAQVISGIGFLGAGTIIKAGFTVKGLTTAASLWAVACLGLAAGMGYHKLTIGGTVAIFATLTLFDWLRRRVVPNDGRVLVIRLDCENLAEVMTALETQATGLQACLRDLSFDRSPGNEYSLQFTIAFPARDSGQDHFLKTLALIPGITRLESLT